MVFEFHAIDCVVATESASNPSWVKHRRMHRCFERFVATPFFFYSTTPYFDAGTPAFLRSPRETFLSNSTEREKTWAGSKAGTNEQSNTSNTGLFIHLIKANWNGGRETSCSVFHSACEKKKKFFFVQISVFVRGQKMSSELIHLLLDKTMARPEPRNRQTNPPNRPTKCKTVFVNCQRRDAAGRTLTQSDKDTVLKIP